MFSSKYVKKIIELNELIDSLTIQLEEEKLKTVDYRAKQLKAAQEASLAIDFQTLRAFSVERVVDGDGYTNTVIGYHLDSAEGLKIKQWYLHCNDELHEKLVQEYNRLIPKVAMVSIDKVVTPEIIIDTNKKEPENA